MVIVLFVNYCIIILKTETKKYMKSHFLAHHIQSYIHELQNVEFELEIQLHHAFEVHEHLQELLFLLEEAVGIEKRRLSLSEALGNI